jgi:hyaluronan synthase
MPETFPHHIRQYLRWMGGAFIRSWWRFRYLPLRSFGFWNHTLAWTQVIVAALLFTYLFLLSPGTRSITPVLIAVPLFMGLVSR